MAAIVVRAGVRTVIGCAANKCIWFCVGKSPHPKFGWCAKLDVPTSRCSLPLRMCPFFACMSSHGKGFRKTDFRAMGGVCHKPIECHRKRYSRKNNYIIISSHISRRRNFKSGKPGQRCAPNFFFTWTFSEFMNLKPFLFVHKAYYYV